MSNEILLLTDEVGAFELEFVRVASLAGRKVRPLGSLAASAQMSLRQSKQGHVSWGSTSRASILSRLAPERPIPGEEYCRAFLHAEALSHLWSCLALWPYTVVNRPSEVGLYGNVTGMAAVDERLAEPARAEVFVSKLPQVEDFNRWWAHCWSSNLSLSVSDLRAADASGPFRLRPGTQASRYIRVFAVGAQAWAFGDVGGLIRRRAEADSIHYCRLMGLDTMQLDWLLAPNDELHLVRVELAFDLPLCKAASEQICKSTLALLAP